MGKNRNDIEPPGYGFIASMGCKPDLRCLYDSRLVAGSNRINCGLKRSPGLDFHETNRVATPRDYIDLSGHTAIPSVKYAVPLASQIPNGDRLCPQAKPKRGLAPLAASLSIWSRHNSLAGQLAPPALPVAHARSSSHMSGSSAGSKTCPN